LSSRDEDLSRRFAEASRRAFSELIERSIAENVAFALISGDVYDGEWKDMSIGHFFNREIAKLARAGIPVFLIKGNHDAASEVTKTLPLPESVRVFADARTETHLIEPLRVAIHGRSFRDRAVTENLARSYPPAEQGYFNIGMLHTSLAGNPAHEVYAPCSLDDLTMRGYDYWALGHVHDFEVIATNPHVVYSGNLQGRSIRECGPKGAVFVDVDETGVTNVRRVIVDQARFADVRVDISGLETEADVTTRMRDSFRSLVEAADGRLIAVRVRLVGAAAIHPALVARRAQIAENAQSALHHVFEDAWLEKFLIESREPEEETGVDMPLALIDTGALLAGLEADPEMRTAAERLIDEIGDQWPSSSEFSKAELVASLDQFMDEARTLVLARASGKFAMPATED
jgi:DNA repair exonuclease SbcCD nuclease subunit